MHKYIFSLLALVAVCKLGQAQNVTVSGALVGNGSYPTLTAAFAAINGGAQGGANIVVSVLNDTWEGSGTALLNASPWTSLTVVPVGQPRTIAGATAAGQPMIDLNGTDHLSFSGLIGGQKGLTFFNNSTSASPGTSTIRLRDDAQQNSITYCKILGASQTYIDSEGGNLVFGMGLNGGNSNNTIDHCDFGPGDANLPSKCLLNKGSTLVANMNVNVGVSNSHFYDCFNAAGYSSAIMLHNGGRNWNIQGNRFYQTGTRTKTSATSHNDIRVSSGFGNVLHLVTNNIFGSRPTPGPVKSHFVMADLTAYYAPIEFYLCDYNYSNSITNNVIKDILIESSTNSGSGLEPTFVGIVNLECNGAVNNNTVGSSTDSSSIVIQVTHPGTVTGIGILGGRGDGQAFSNNQIGGITMRHLAGGSVHFTGIGLKQFLQTADINGNNIGFASAPIVLDAPSGGGKMLGISGYATYMTAIDNVVAHFFSNQTTTEIDMRVVDNNIGIDVGSLGAPSLVRGNTVHSWVLRHPTGSNTVKGMQVDNISTVKDNHIHSLHFTNSNPASVLIGLSLKMGNPAVQNNMIRLGYSPAGQPITTGIGMYGVHNWIGQPQLDYNSVYLGGGGVGDTSDTYAVYSMNGHPNSRYLNNIFFNARSNGSGTGTHYALVHGGVPQILTMPVSNGNDLLAPEVGGKIGRIVGVDQATIFDWRLTTGQDFNSISHDPNFLQPTGNAATGDLHIGSVSPIEGIGVAGSNVTQDYDQQQRSSLTPRDIGADAGNFTPLAVLQPEVDVRGNGLMVLDGDVTPSTSDGTDFGTVPVCSGAAASRSFQLRNLGNANLVLSGLSVSGSGAFTVQPLGVSTLIPGQLVSVTVQFSATVPGTYSATLTLLSNDQDEAVYTFDLFAVAENDTLAPMAVCQPIIVPVGANGIAVVNGAAFGAASTDNCGITSYTATPAQFTCSDVGPQTVQLSLSDAAGNVSACTGTLTVADQLAPQAICNSFSLAFGPGNTAQTTVAALDGGSTDNCGIDSIWAAPLSYTCAQAGANAVQLSVRDSAGNVGTCIATVTVLESMPPVAVCQPSTLPLNANGLASLDPAWIDGGSTDNCGVTSFSASPSLFSCADVGVRPVTLTVADGSGNTDTCSTYLVVQDLLPPTLTCANFTVSVGGSAPLTLIPNQAGIASDPCGIASTQLSLSQVGCAHAGTQPLTLTATDTHGNSDSCTVQLTVLISPMTVLVQAPTGPCGYHIGCAGQASGTVTALVNGGCAPYTYFWANGEAAATATMLSAGTHNVTVTSADGQQLIRTVTLTEPAPLSLSLAATPSCLNGSTGTATAVASGGQSCQPYTYLWSNGAVTPSTSGLSPGTYGVTLTDAAGCTATASVLVGTVSSTGLAITQIGGGLSATTGFVAYQWQDASGPIPGATSAQYVPSSSGTYQVTATDIYGCTWTSVAYTFTYVGRTPQTASQVAISWHPNPSTGVYHLSVSRPVAGPVALTVQDLRGRVLRRATLAALENGTMIDLSDLAVGAYLVELRDRRASLGHFKLIRN